MDAKLRQDVLNVILSHQSPSAIERMIDWWKDYAALDSILLLYGGQKHDFAAISHPAKIFIDDPRLRTRDHQRELQSYTELFRAADRYLEVQGSQFRFVYFAEYDHLPVAPDLNERQVNQLTKEHADMLGFHLHRIDGTSSAHYLYHAANKEFASYWHKISCRPERDVILSMFGSGSFWTREAFCSVASVTEPFPIYMEIYLPTLAHHLGFRVRHIADQDRFVRALPNEIIPLEQARKEDAWTLHPIKDYWGT